MQLRAHMKVKTEYLPVFPAILGDFRKNLLESMTFMVALRTPSRPLLGQQGDHKGSPLRDAT